MNSVMAILKPGDGLAWLVFSLVLAAFFAGLSAAIVSARKGPPSVDVRAAGGGLEDVDFQLTTRSDRIAEATPGLLIMIGLLGTFIGIALAIRHAHDAVLGSQGRELGETLASLGPMLGEIGVKFQSSAWGLLGSLLLRPIVFVLATEPRHRAARDKFREIERVRAAAEDEHRANLKAITLLAQTQLVSISDSSSAAAKVLERWGEVLSRLDRTAHSMQQSADGSLAAAKQLTAGLTKLTSDFERTIKAASDATAAATAKNELALRGVQSAVQTSQEELKSAMQGSLGELKKAHLAANEASTTSVKESKKQVEQVFTNLTKTFTGAMRELQTTLAEGQIKLARSVTDAGKQSDEAVQRVGKSMNGSVGAMEQAIGALERQLGTAIAASTKAMEQGVDGLAKQSKELAGGIAKQARESQEQATAQHAAAMRSLDERLANLEVPLGKMEAAVAQVNVVINDMNRMSIRSDTTLRDVASSSKSMGDAVEKLNTSLNGLIGSFSQTTKLLLKGLEDAAAQARAKPTEVNAVRTEAR